MKIMISPYIYPGIEAKPLSQERIIRLTCKQFNTEYEDVFKKCRLRDIVTSRQVSFYLLRKYMDINTTNVGKIFNLDHSTVVYGTNNIKNLIEFDVEMRHEVSQIETVLKAEYEWEQKDSKLQAT